MLADVLEQARTAGAPVRVLVESDGQVLSVAALEARAELGQPFSEAVSRRAGAGGRHLLRVADAGELDGCLWIAYSVGSARPLTAYRKRLLLPTETCFELLADLARGLDEALGEGLLPYEVGPDSVFVTERGAKLGDLGIAREVCGGEGLPNSAYAPPEVLRGEPAGALSAAYLLGALAYHLLAGASPRADLDATSGGGVSLASWRPDLPAGVDAIVAAALASDPSRRPPSAGNVHELLRQAIRDEAPASAGPQPRAPQPPAQARSRRRAQEAPDRDASPDGGVKFNWSDIASVSEALRTSEIASDLGEAFKRATADTTRERAEEAAAAARKARADERARERAAKEAAREADAARQAEAAREAEAREAARREAAARAKAEAEEAARREAAAEEAARREAEEAARREAEEAARREAEEAERRDVAARAKAEAEAQEAARRDAEKRAEGEAAAQARAQAEADKAARREAAARAKAEAGAERAAREAEKKAQHEAAALAKAEAKTERLARREAQEAAKREAAARAKAEDEARKRAEREASARAKAEDEARKRAEREAAARAKAEDEARKLAEREAAAHAKAQGKAEAKREKAARRAARSKARRERGAAADAAHRERGGAAGAADRDGDAAVEPARRQRGARGEPARKRRSRAVAAAGLLGVGAVAAAATLALVPEQGSGDTRLTAANGLSIEPPSGWRETGLSSGRFVPLEDAVAASPANARDIALVAGILSDPAAAREVLARALPDGTSRAPATLGRYEAWRYPGVRASRGLTGAAYLAETTGGTLFVLCYAPPGEAGGPLADCARATATVQLDGESGLSRDAVEKRDELLRDTVFALRDEWLAGRRRLAAAAVASEQAPEARALAASFATAADSIEEIDDPSGDLDLTGLADLLRTTGAAYEDLGAAIAKGDQRAYDEARDAITSGENETWDAVRRSISL